MSSDYNPDYCQYIHITQTFSADLVEKMGGLIDLRVFELDLALYLRFQQSLEVLQSICISFYSLLVHLLYEI